MILKWDRLFKKYGNFLKQNSTSVTLYLTFFFIAIQYALFYNRVDISIKGHYPAGYDQNQYLYQSYYTYTHALKDGFLRAIDSYFKTRFPVQGILLQIQAIFYYFFFGAGRLQALSINFIYFATLQLFSFYVPLKVFKSKTLAFVSLGCFLCVESAYRTIGGIFDFRLDFSSFCLWGIFIFMVLLSRCFVNRFWSRFLIIISVSLCLLRSILFTYLLGVYGLFLSFLIINLFFAKKHKVRTKIRIKHILQALIGSCVFFVPIIILNWNAFYHYYGIGHILGPEKNIRALEQGIFTSWDNYFFYFNQIYLHLGSHIFLSILACILIIAPLYFYASFKQKVFSKFKRIYHLLFFCLLCFVVPLFILTVNTSKSPVVGSILLPAILILFIFFLHPSLKIIPQKLKLTLAIFFCLSGICQAWYGYINTNTQDHFLIKRTLNNIYNDLALHCIENKIEKITCSSNYMSEEFYFPNLGALTYESFGYILDIEGTSLGGSIFALDWQTIKKEIDRSDVFVYYVNDYPYTAPYPFYDSMRLYRQDLIREVKKQYDFYKTYKFVGSNTIVDLYIKKPIQIFGLTADQWVSKEGLTIELPAETKSFSFRGEILTQKMKPFFKVTAQFIEPTSASNIIEMKWSDKDNFIFVNGNITPALTVDSKIKIEFSPLWIPKEKGIGQDVRPVVLHNIADIKSAR